MNGQWSGGNRYEILENGTDFYPAVFGAIRAARREVLVETFILFEDPVGIALQQALIEAARRGVSVDLTIDGYGSDGLTQEFVRALAQGGVRLHVFDPRPRLLGMRTNLFRRMHRKIAAIDGEVDFVGGINFSEDHLPEYGPQAKQDYTLRIEGPLARDIADFARAALKAPARRFPRSGRIPGGSLPQGDGAGRLVLRDNVHHRDDIERHYRAGICTARHDVLIANAYFFPGYLLLRDLAHAARRGVRVRLIVQGQPDMPIAQWAASMLYDYLTDAGVAVYEYCKQPMHAKVACMDEAWSTVGSSNLDPFSLALNLEANVVAHDRPLNAALRLKLERLIEEDCEPARRPGPAVGRLRRLWTGVVVFHFLRRFPAWAGSLPAHKPRLRSVPTAQ
jgi:cardiolipin synthase